MSFFLELKCNKTILNNRLLLNFLGKPIECLGSGGSTVSARLKLEGIDGRAPPGVESAA